MYILLCAIYLPDMHVCKVLVRTSGDSIRIKRHAIFAGRQYSRIRTGLLCVYVYMHAAPKYMCRLMMCKLLYALSFGRTRRGIL